MRRLRRRSLAALRHELPPREHAVLTLRQLDQIA